MTNGYAVAVDEDKKEVDYELFNWVKKVESGFLLLIISFQVIKAKVNFIHYDPHNF